MNILLVTDAFTPQTNGVVTTLTNLVKQLMQQGHKVQIIEPSCHKRSFPSPYPDVKIGFCDKKYLQKNIEWADAIHIATPEGTLGWQATRMCNKLGLQYTTSYHTKWPEFINSMYPWVSKKLVERWIKHIHRRSKAILVPTNEVKRELSDYGLEQAVVWTRGVDREQFVFNDNPEEYFLCVSRVSKEKNLEDFFNLPGRKIMVGDGPMLEEYKQKYPEVEFTGLKTGKELASYYQDAFCFVFPSRNDTFGLVMIEAMACGTPVAAYPVTGPIDVVEPGKTGYLDNDLKNAVRKCLGLDRQKVYTYSEKWSWENCAKQFISTLESKNVGN